MEIFKSLAKMKNAKVKSESVQERRYTGTLDIGGRIKITKGCLSAEVEYWARICESTYTGYIVADDWEEQGLEKVTISGLEIDSMDKFKKGLAEHGMDSVANSLDITREEINDEVFKDMMRHPSISVLFGTNKLWNALSKEKKQDVAIDQYIQKYETNPIHFLRNNNVISHNYQGVLSVEQLLQFKKDRVMIVNEVTEETK